MDKKGYWLRGNRFNQLYGYSMGFILSGFRAGRILKRIRLPTHAVSKAGSGRPAPVRAEKGPSRKRGRGPGLPGQPEEE
jgi:hypothetical protein